MQDLVTEIARVTAALAKSEQEREYLDQYIKNHTLLDPLNPFFFRLPFAGESESISVLSRCHETLLPMFITKEATVLRQLCREFKTTVAEFPWEDETTVILGDVADWRACFPRASCANVREHYSGGREISMEDEEFVHFLGVKRLDMRGCTSVTDAAFEHLKGIHTLNMAGCNQLEITDAAFTHLKGIHTLNMADCNQFTVSPLALAHLKGIHSLSLYNCTQLTGNGFAWDCSRTLNSGVFLLLKGVKSLNIGCCRQFNLLNDSIKGVERLNLFGHSTAQVERVKDLGYPVVQIESSDA